MEHLFLLLFLNTCSGEKLKMIHTGGLEWFHHRWVKETLSKIGFVLMQFLGSGLSVNYGEIAKHI